MPEIAAVTDQRLREANEGLAAGRYRVLSLDVFDSLLWRRVPEPADVFILLGRALAAGGKLRGHVSALGFADLRLAAERAAREKVEAITGYREIKLADIYDALPDHIFAEGFDKAARLAAELACERGVLILDQDLVALMRTAKAGGARVILASDTYFTSTELGGLLAGAGFAEPKLIARTYVSCETGKPKYRDLFDVILKDQGVTAGEMIHIGDTMEADVNPCRARGIAVVHYDKWGFSPRLRDIEFPPERDKRTELLGERGDFGLSGLRSRLAHRAPAILGAPLTPYWSYGAAVLAPIFTAYARWVVDTVRREGADRVLGVMREGRFLRRVVEATAERMGLGLAIGELWMSRRAVTLAALFADDLNRLPDAIMLNPGRTTDEILKGLGLGRSDLKGVLPADFDLRRPGAVAALAQAIVATPTLKDKVLAVSAGHRANLLRGLGKLIDLSKPQTIALLDLGYAATIQTVLGQILQRAGAKIRLVGLYLAHNDKAMANVRAGADIRAYLGNEGFLGTTAALISRTPDVLEHACMCREGTLETYDAVGEPVLLPSQRDETQITQMETVQAGVLAGMAAVDGLLGGLDKTAAEAPTLKLQVAQIILAAMLYPTPAEAAGIGGWQHEANFDLADIRRFTDLSFNPAELEYRGLPSLQTLARQQVYWPAAALMSANPYIGGAFAAGAMAAYSAEHLTAGPLLGGVIICPDLGAGFDTRRQGAMPLAINAFGRGHIQVMVKPFGGEAYRRLRLTWPGARAVVQIDQIAASYIGENERRPARLGAVAWSGTTEIAPGLHLTAADQAGEAVVDLDAPPPFAHALELTLRFKYLRVDPLFGAR